MREGRTKATEVIDNNPNPVWNQEFDFIVDDAVSEPARWMGPLFCSALLRNNCYCCSAL